MALGPGQTPLLAADALVQQLGPQLVLSPAPASPRDRRANQAHTRDSRSTAARPTSPSRCLARITTTRRRSRRTCPLRTIAPRTCRSCRAPRPRQASFPTPQTDASSPHLGGASPHIGGQSPHVGGQSPRFGGSVHGSSQYSDATPTSELPSHLGGYLKPMGSPGLQADRDRYSILSEMPTSER